MDEAVSVGLGERAEHGTKDAHDHMGGHGAAFVEDFPQGAAGNELHDEEGMSVVKPVVENLHDTGMREPCDRFGLEFEAADEGIVAGEGGGEKLQCDVAVEARIRCEIDGRHAAVGDRRFETVAAINEIART